MKSQYKGADEWFVLNDKDPYLKPIYISLPTPPPLERIDGYGKRVEDQRFERLKVPSRLEALEADIMRDLNRREALERDFRINGYTMYKAFWDKLDLLYDDYQTEIQWLKRVWWHRINGYWFYNRGKPTYISGWHFTYLNFFYLGEAGQFPDYRDRDRRWFLAQKYAYECKETFMDYDKKGNAKKVDGIYRMKETKNRMFYGCVNSKARRMGDTTKALVPYHELGVTAMGGICGIISFGGDSSETVFEMKFVPAWQSFPLWMRPMFSNTNKPTAVWYEPLRTKYGEKGLGTVLNAASTSNQRAYDSKAVTYLLLDEQGKTTRDNVNARWTNLRKCLTEGDIIKGYSIHPTTVEEMDEGGGKQFYEMMENANFYNRLVETGQTVNGLMRAFFRASDGRLGTIDSYGYSVEFEPTEWQKKEGFDRGSFLSLNAEREQLKKIGTTDAMASYRGHQREDPLYYMDSFVTETGGLRFDYLKIGENMDRLKIKTKARRYNIEVDPSDVDGYRRLVPNEDGKFLVSIDLPAEATNQRVRVMEYDPVKREDVWTYNPMDMGRFVASGDPINYFTGGDIKRTGKKFSKVGGVVFWNRDINVDPGDDMEQWESYRTVVTYAHSPIDTYEYCEDLLNMCVYFGAPMYPEINITAIWEHFVSRGYSGYLLYDIDPVSGKVKNKPGIYLNGANKQDGFNLIEMYTKYRLHKEEHLELLEELDAIKSIEDLTKHDLLAAFMCAVLGSKSKYSERLEKFNQNVDLGRLGSLF